MPIGLNALELQKYFRAPETAFGKSIQRNWKFYATFLYNPMKSLNFGRLDFPPILEAFHILDVTIPTYEFEKVVMMYGQVPKSLPVLKFEGFNIDVVMEEDEQGSVEYFINWNQRNIINRDGLYNAPDDVKINALVIEIQDKMGLPVIYYIYHDLYFLAASPAIYSYTSNESIKRTVTFGVDRLSTVFVKKNAVAQAAGLLSSVRK
jgi:hypothetical protein